MIVKRFADKLDDIDNKYIFGVATYGGDFGTSFKTLSKIIENRNGKLSAKYGIQMPQNAFNKPWENIDKVIKKANKKVEEICEKIENRYEGYLLRSKIMNIILTPFYIVIKSLYKSGIAKISGSDKNLEINELINRADIGFEVKDNCKSCGMCQKVCPVNNIKLENGKPVWLHKCENCLACFNLCPQEAIETTIVSKNYHYKYPGIKAEKMMIKK